jgi:hypothetical protein
MSENPFKVQDLNPCDLKSERGSGRKARSAEDLRTEPGYFPLIPEKDKPEKSRATSEARHAPKGLRPRGNIAVAFAAELRWQVHIRKTHSVWI